jgi:hypothetical protein
MISITSPPDQTETSNINMRPGISWHGMVAVLTFFAGTLFSAGMGWSHSNDSLNNIAVSISRLEGEVKALSDKYAISDKELQKLEDHIEYDDARLDKLEAKPR